MAGNQNSGRKPRHLEERKLIGKHFKESVSTVVGLMQDKDTPAHVRLDASKVLIDQHIGRAPQSQTIELTGKDGQPIAVTRVVYKETEVKEE